MTHAAVPDWVERVTGRIPVLLIAPHGGRRPARSELEPGSPRKSNDLHTAELTLELAARTGAAAIVNPTHDRNTIDLNRVSHLRRAAPWLVDLLLQAARGQIERQGRATFVFIHGWNAIQPACDIGIGARLEAGRLVSVREGVPTVSSAFLGRLIDLAADCHAEGIEMTFGDRYPAATRENVLQLFTRRYADDRDPAVRELATLGAAGRIVAVQLELAVPLRWPGPLRERFLERLSKWLCCRESLDGSEPLEPAPAESRPHVPPKRLTLEFHDGSSGIGGFAGIERLSTGRRHARLLLCLGRSRLGLFTGEHPRENGPPLSCSGMRWVEDGAGRLRIDYEGPILLFGRSDPFLDLEAGLSTSTLTSARAQLEWQALELTGRISDLARPGRLRGTIDVDGTTTPIDTPAPLGPPTRERAESWVERRVLHVVLGEDLLLSVHSHLGTGETAVGEIIRGQTPEAVLSARTSVLVAADGLTPQGLRIEVISRAGALRAFGRVTTAIPVVRSGEGGRWVVFYGLARFESPAGFATFEISRRLDETPPPSQG